jgi:PKHD-type hydroxylase
MLIQIPKVLTKEEVAKCHQIIKNAQTKEVWVDGKVTAGLQARQVKNNLQIAENHEVIKELQTLILRALEKNQVFISAALPLKVFPPSFNSYGIGQYFGPHIDNAIRQIGNSTQRIRTDLSATLFLTEIEDYDGGELIIEDTYGSHSVKLEAGNMILYPSSSLHYVKEVTRGVRVSSFFWIQSMVKSDEDRTLLFNLDSAIQSIIAEKPNNPANTKLTGIYNNLLRKWADA